MQAYLLKALPRHHRGVWRTIEITDLETLHDLHYALQEAFLLGDDHLYAFYMGPKVWDANTEYGGPESGCPRKTEKATMAWLKLKKGQKFLYLYDFGAEQVFPISVMEVRPVEAGVAYPRIVGSKGVAPSMFDDEEECEE